MRSADSRQGAAYDRIWSRLSERLTKTLEMAQHQTAAAPGLLAELLARPHEKRLELAQSRKEFRSAPLLAALLERSHQLLARDAEEAERLALLAFLLLPELAEGGISSMLASELAARAWGLVGDARRRRGSLATAEEAFGEAAAWLSVTSSELEQAAFCSLLADLRRAQDRALEAQALSAHASALFASATELREHGDALEEQAQLQRALGHLDAAIGAAADAFLLAEPRLDPLATLEPRYQWARCLAAQGKTALALATVKARLPERQALPADLRSRIDALSARLLQPNSQTESAPDGSLFELFLHTRRRLTAESGPWASGPER